MQTTPARDPRSSVWTALVRSVLHRKPQPRSIHTRAQSCVHRHRRHGQHAVANSADTIGELAPASEQWLRGEHHGRAHAFCLGGYLFLTTLRVGRKNQPHKKGVELRMGNGSDFLPCKSQRHFHAVDSLACEKCEQLQLLAVLATEGFP